MALRRPEDPAIHGEPAAPSPQPRPSSRQMWEDRLAALEKIDAVDEFAKRLGGAFSKIVRPGPAKDLLSGTPLGHPAHPMLTDVVIGAWTSAVVLDLLPTRRTNAGADALVALGVLSAVPTAVTGVSDLADVTERDTRTLGGAHAIGNLAATALFATSWLQRRRGHRGTGVALSLMGIAISGVAGYIGGHLSYRRGVGVDETTFEDPMSEWTAAIDAADLGDRPKKVTVGRNEIMLMRDGERILALANRCTHRGGPLHKGMLEDGAVTCPWHRSSFRLDDGAIVCGPATAPQPSYDARVRGGTVEVRRR